MTFSRLHVSKATTNRLKALKSRTGLTPNIICRLALCYSLADPHAVDPKSHDAAGMEFLRSTVLGEYEELYIALARQRLSDDSSDISIDEAIRAHINRGVELLSPRLKSIADVADLLPRGNSH